MCLVIIILIEINSFIISLMFMSAILLDMKFPKGLSESTTRIFSLGAPNLTKFRRGGCRFDKGGLTKKFEFLRDKNVNLLEILR